MNRLIHMAGFIPVNEERTTLSLNRVSLSAPGRSTPLELRITAPMEGDHLPVILLSHGHGPSLYLPSKDGYGPLAQFYAEHGFVVIQASHANSKVAGLEPTAPDGPLFCRIRAEEMRLIIDRLEEIEAMAPFIRGRIDHQKIAAVGHSLGGHTVSLLLGARMTDPNDAVARNARLHDPRIKAGVLLAAPGNGGKDLSDYAAQHYSVLNTDFSTMTSKALVVYGDSDTSPHLTKRGADWHADPFHESPGADYLLTLIGAKHGLGGISGFDAKEADDENPDRLAITQRMSWAYLQSALHEGDTAWENACAALKDQASEFGFVTGK
ncbi:dienelactone hydrolase [Allorhizobium sp. BGMRC 0089]|uniref:alpha/beta hydrolase family protein n=1 Tax=Allorhizobium sonneratiae TaxID=2934936 RepID=UPI0020337F69|nr:dienelactone hydrolase [Allorhizobium sonneratiae]MCM2292247.1 dienelactone hydrolase [Allorhizobium sonneratiae]